MRPVQRALGLIGASVILAACSSTPPAPPAKPAAPAPAPVAAVTPPPAALPAPAPAPAAIADYLDPKSRISTERSVYFDFDNFSIRTDQTPVVELQGKYLAAHPQLNVKVEGNTDERGGSEYNLALGQKRAEATIKALQVYGAQPGQMEAVSWGKERPKAAGHDETAWAQNRRADVSYPTR